MKIHEAAAQVMGRSGRPMTAKEIYDAINNERLFKFEAKDPVSVMSQALRKKCDVPTNKGKVLFRRTGPNTFVLAG